MIAAQNKYIGSAYRHLQMISQDDEKRMEYEARAKAIRDYNQGMLEAEQRGEARGRAEGEARGRTEGIHVLIADNIEEGIPKEKTFPFISNF